MAYFCHQCQQIVNVSVTPDLHCRVCNGDFVEEVNPREYSADSDDGPGGQEEGGPPPRGYVIIRQHVEPTNENEQPPLAQNPLLNLLNPGLIGSTFARILHQQAQPQQPATTRASGGLFGTVPPRQPPTSSASGSGTAAGGSRIGGGRSSDGPPPGGATLNNENAFNFINQLLSNLSENTNNGQPNFSRVTFHFGGPPPQNQSQQHQQDADGGGGGANGPMPFGLPFLQNIIHGNVNDYAWGPEGLDAIATQLLNQFDNGPAAHVPPADLQRLPMTEVNEAHVENGTQCATCMETFQLKEAVAQLDCRHIFHRPCIEPWLKKQNTCPICRKVVDPKTWGDGGARPSEIVDVDELD